MCLQNTHNVSSYGLGLGMQSMYDTRKPDIVHV